jgi:signal transduction histidine kinase
MSTQIHAGVSRKIFSRSAVPVDRTAAARYVAGVLGLALAYFAVAKGAQSLRYTASVSAIWPPAGVGIAVLYLAGIRWWPGIFVGELLVNGDLLASGSGLPVGSLVGQQAGNMAEVIVGALLLRRLIGERAALDRTDQVGGMLLALGTGTAISATFGTVSMLAGDVITQSQAATFWRTWWLGDSAGALVAVPLVITWARAPVATLRRLVTWEGALLLAAVIVLAVVSVQIDESVTYMVFPALIWAAFRFGPAVAALSTAIAAGIAIGFTAHKQGAFFNHPIDQRVLSTQLYILVAALTTSFLSAVVAERRRSAAELVEAQLREGERALEERHRIARELHDSVSQALFSTVLHTRAAQKALARQDVGTAGSLSRALRSIGELTRNAQGEMRALIFELGNEAGADGFLAALSRHAATLTAQGGFRVDIEAPSQRLSLPRQVETQLYGIGREALTNAARHAQASNVTVRVEERAGHVSVQIDDDGCGFDSTTSPVGHYGLESMRSRAAEIDAHLTIASTRGAGTVIRVEVPLDSTWAVGAPD